MHLILLAKDKYELAIHDLMGMRINNLFARSVVENHVDGKVFVDDDINPNLFYVIHPYGMSLLFGKVSADFCTTRLKDYILCRNKLRKTNEFLQVYPNEIETKIDKILGEKLYLVENMQNHEDQIFVKHKRINFKFNHEIFSKFISNHGLNKYIFRKVDDSLFNETEGKVVPKRFWNNANDFTLYGVGYTLRYDSQDVAIAFSAFLHDDMLELGIETKEKYRRHGFACIVCAKLILYCLENNFEPVWSCGLDNRASYNLALTLGFEPVRHLAYYALPMLRN
jgi:RimJ/RimL family protein N-acetyltransferase